MTTTRFLYELHGLDQLINDASIRLTGIDKRLGNRSVLERLEDNLAGKRHQLALNQGQHKDFEMMSETIREKVRRVHEQLYGGSTRNPRELQDLDHELKNLTEQLGGLEDSILESLLILEELEGVILEETRKLEDEQDIWGQDQERLTEEKHKVLEDLDDMKSQREVGLEKLGARHIELYEKLRIVKGGIAVALVERGLCLSCSVTLPSHQLQRARVGREPVLCGNCGRILYVI